MIKKTCKTCRKIFKVKKYRENKTKYCSRKCLHSGKKVEKICLTCGRIFEVKKSRGNTAKYCSRKCLYLKTLIEKRCLICEKIFKVAEKCRKNTAKYCSVKCRSYDWNKENNPNWRGGIARGRLNNDYKLWRKAVFERDGFRCLICGKVGGILNAHHIKNWAGYPKLRYDTDNGMTMCQDCHNLVDIELSLFSIKKPRQKQRKI